MDNSRPSSPDAPPQDLWDSILNSVSSSRSIPSKQIVILGQPSTGKSALASALLQKPPSDENNEEGRIDFAVGYDFADVKDDADEDTLARLSVYTVPSSSPAYTGLLPHFLPPKSALPHTLVMIVLDWTRPWTFIEELQTWLQWVEDWAKGDSARELEIIREENRERLQSHLQHYTEPSSEPQPASTSTLSSTLLPLGPGTFTHNAAGVPIIVVCTKADLIDETAEITAGATGMGGMVKGKGGEWEERTDGIMQVLRTICLKYGAGLLYTTPLPATLQVLRQYALHLLFMPPAPSPGMASEGAVPARNIFPFQHKPNTLDRDHILVPAGWDSWGKIGVLRDGFDAKMWNEAWETDLEGDSEEPGAKRLYMVLVPDQGPKPHVLPPFNSPVPEQNFLAKHYDENAKKSDRDPRGAFRNPADASAGIVGPMGSSSFSLPNVERALLEMEAPIAPTGGANLGASTATRLGARPGAAVAGRPSALSGLAPSSISPTTAGGRTPTTPTPGSAASPPAGQTQHEVLHNFFQSLLNTKGSPQPPARTATTTQATRPNGAANGAEEDNS